MNDDLDYVADAVKSSADAKAKKKLDSYMRSKMAKGETFRVTAAASYEYPTGVMRKGVCCVEIDENDSFDFYRLLDLLTQEEREEFVRPLQEEMDRMQKQLAVILKQKKFAKVPYNAETLEDEKKAEKVRKWEDELFAQIEKIGYCTDSEHHGYGSYLLWFDIPFNKHKKMKAVVQTKPEPVK